VIIALEQATHKADVAGTGLTDKPECLSEQLSNRFVGVKRQRWNEHRYPAESLPTWQSSESLAGHPDRSQRRQGRV